MFYLEPLSKAVSEQLPFVPYLLLLRMLRDHPAHEEVGVACRESVMSEGVIHQILASLSSFGHSPRIKPTDTPQGMDRYTHVLLYYVHVHTYTCMCVCACAHESVSSDAGLMEPTTTVLW